MRSYFDPWPVLPPGAKADAVRFKEEDSFRGQAIGPVTVLVGETVYAYQLDAETKTPAWFTMPQAKKIAKILGAPLAYV